MLLKWVLRWMAVVSIVTSAKARSNVLKRKRDTAHITDNRNLCRELESNENPDVRVVCSHVHSLHEVLQYLTEDQRLKITTLTLTQSNFSSLSLDDLVNLTALHTLIFNQSLISEWKIPKATSVPKVTDLILNGCWNNYNLLSPHRNASLQFKSRMFDGLQSLEHLHLVNCYVSNMTSDIFHNMTSLKKLYLSGGCGIGCEPHMDWVLDWIDANKAVVANDTTCFVPRDLEVGGGVLVMSTYFSLSGHPFLLIMNHRKETEEHCPKDCRCVVEGFNYGRNGQRNRDNPIINIYCDNLGLTTLPEVPPYSTRITFANNSITDISRLFTSERYRNVTSIRLEHNRISHLDGDLFYNFLKDRPHDLYITLSHNNFSTLPVKQMMRVYKEAQLSKSFMPVISLGFNPWNCSDCSFLSDFQEFVYYQYYSREAGHHVYYDIRCAGGNDEIMAGQMIITLDIETLCRPDPPLLEPIDILNISLALLIIVFIANFVHNFYQYRQHSKLPWIITKVPCC